MKSIALLGVRGAWVAGMVCLAAGWVRGAGLEPLMTTRGELLWADGLNGVGAVPAGWRSAKGTWRQGAERVTGEEVPEQKHAAVIRRAVAGKDLVVAFSFRLDQARQVTVSFNDSHEHVCRLLINRDGFTVQKDDHDHAGPDKPVKFMTERMKIDPTVWHEGLVEIRGEEMVAQIDGPGRVAFGGHPTLAVEKASVGFTVSKGTAEFREVKIWRAEERGDWEKTKAGLSARR